MNARLYFIAIACISYAISLFCPVFIGSESGHSSFILGFVCLLLGWGYDLAWFANPLLIAAIVIHLLKRDRLALVLSTLAFAVALHTLTLHKIDRDEAGHTETVVGYNIGFYLWLFSIFSILISCLVMSFKPKPASSVEEQKI